MTIVNNEYDYRHVLENAALILLALGDDAIVFAARDTWTRIEENIVAVTPGKPW